MRTSDEPDFVPKARAAGWANRTWLTAWLTPAPMVEGLKLTPLAFRLVVSTIASFFWPCPRQWGTRRPPDAGRPPSRKEPIMARVYKPTYLKPVPAGAEIVQRDGKP